MRGKTRNGRGSGGLKGRCWAAGCDEWMGGAWVWYWCLLGGDYCEGDILTGAVMSDVGLLHKELSGRILTAFHQVHNELGVGFLEIAYRRAMQIALADLALPFASEVPVFVYFRGQSIGQYRIDLVIDDKIIVECKCVERLAVAHEAQLLNYLRATNFSVGLLLNFGSVPSFKRMVYESRRKV